MDEKIQAINGNWWYMYGGSWKDLGIPSTVSRVKAKEQAEAEISDFRKHVEEENKKAWIKNAINHR